MRFSIAMVALSALIGVFMLQSLGRTLYVHHFEFDPAKVEWDAAHDRRDRDGMIAALRKERIAHCRTFDPFWFYGRWANRCDLD